MMLQEKKTYKEAVACLAAQVEREILRQPQLKAEIIQAWAETFENIKKKCKEYEQSTNAGSDSPTWRPQETYFGGEGGDA